METVDQARETIFEELTSDDSEVRRDYLKLFEGDAKAVADAMATAFIKWREFDNGVKGDEKRAHVSALISTFGWLISNVDTATTPLLWAAVVAVAALTIGIFLLHRRINRHIQFLREL